MSHIGGNTQAFIQINEIKENSYGNECAGWINAILLTGFLDMMDEGANSRTLMHKVEDADYVFISDYFEPVVRGIKLSAENSRMLIDGEVYDVKLYDDPMRLHEHMEIYLKYLGGQ